MILDTLSIRMGCSCIPITQVLEREGCIPGYEWITLLCPQKNLDILWNLVWGGGVQIFKKTWVYLDIHVLVYPLPTLSQLSKLRYRLVTG